MCFFMHVITQDEVGENTLQSVEKERLYVRDNSNLVLDRKTDSFYYDINNGHCACEIVVSPFAKTNEVKQILKDIQSKGDFRFYVTNADEEDINEYMKKNENFEKKLSEMDIKKVSFEELMELYPEKINFEKLYFVGA